jgi:hypothetical protein
MTRCFTSLDADEYVTCMAYFRQVWQLKKLYPECGLDRRPISVIMIKRG